MKDSNNRHHDRRSDQSRRPEPHDLSVEEQFLGVGRFSCHSDLTGIAESPRVVKDRKVRKRARKQYAERRSDRERRCGKDTRSETDRFLQGERRSGLDRREIRYRSFKNARVFVRRLELKSVDDWREYTKSGAKPDNIPFAPHYIYAADGWAGWGDWLGTSEVAASLSHHRHRFFKKLRAFACALGLTSGSNSHTHKSANKPVGVPASAHNFYADLAGEVGTSGPTGV